MCGLGRFCRTATSHRGRRPSRRHIDSSTPSVRKFRNVESVILPVNASGSQSSIEGVAERPFNVETSVRPLVSVVAWSNVPERSREIASALGGESKCIHDLPFVNPRLTPLRYAASAVLTVLYLLVRRPRAVIASNPPVIPGLIAYLYGCIAGVPVVLDSHPSAFGFYKNKKFIKLLMPLHHFLIPRVQGSMVAVDELAGRVQRLGGEAVIVHEAPPLWESPPAPPLRRHPTILFVCSFNIDEPVSLVIEAARQLPHVDIVVTGDLRKAPPQLIERPAPNLSFVGYLDQSAYQDALVNADIVMTLTNRPEAVNRVANEAVFARRPLIVSDWPALERYFPCAIRVSPSVDGVVAGVNDALQCHDELRSYADVALEVQLERWNAQCRDLRKLIGMPSL